GMRGGAGAKDQEIVHTIRLDEVILLDQCKARFPSFFDHHARAYPVILAVAVAIVYPYKRAGSQSLPKMSQQPNPLRDLVISLDDQHRVNPFSRQHRIVLSSEHSVND